MNFLRRGHRPTDILDPDHEMSAVTSDFVQLYAVSIVVKLAIIGYWLSQLSNETANMLIGNITMFIDIAVKAARGLSLLIAVSLLTNIGLFVYAVYQLIQN